MEGCVLVSLKYPMCVWCTSRNLPSCEQTCRRVALLISSGVNNQKLESILKGLSLADVHRLNSLCSSLYAKISIQGGLTLCQSNYPWEAITYAMVASKLSQKRIGVYSVQQFLGNPAILSEDLIEVCILTDFGKFIKGLMTTKNNYDCYNFVKYVMQNSCLFLFLSSVLTPVELAYFHNNFPIDCNLVGGVV